MKQIKIAIFCVLALTGFLFMGELSILNLDSFQSEYYESDFYIDSLSRGTTSREMISDFCKAAKSNDVDFFAVKFTYVFRHSLYVFDLYCNQCIDKSQLP